MPPPPLHQGNHGGRPPAGGGQGGSGRGSGGTHAEAGRLEKGEALVRSGRLAEDRGRPDEALAKYKRGLRYLLEVLAQLAEDDLQVPLLKQMVAEHLERSARVKEQCAKLGI